MEHLKNRFTLNSYIDDVSESYEEMKLILFLVPS